jgi:hypothetical protein
MAIKMVSMLAIVIIVGFSFSAEAAFQGPIEVASCQFGSDSGQMGLLTGDSGDTLPPLEAVTPDGKIVISDPMNKKQIIFDLNGNVVKEVKWAEKRREGGQTFYEIPEYSFGPIVGYSATGNIYTSSGGKYFLVSPAGQLLQTYSEKPLELGEVKEKKMAPGKYKVTLKYPDKTWEITREGAFSSQSYMRDVSGNLYGIGSNYVVRYDDQGKEVAKLTMPKARFEGVTLPPDWPPNAEPPRNEVLEGYGSPVLAPNGDVYTWKRTPDNYYIIKWVWQ